MILNLLSLTTIFMSGTFGQPSYEYDCEHSFSRRNSSIFVQQNYGPTSCYWKVKAHQDETFQLTFNDFGVDPYYADCLKQYVSVQDGHLKLVHCGRDHTPYTIKTSGNILTIRYWKNSNGDKNFHLDAHLRIANTKSVFTVHDMSVTWSDAATACKQSGGYLARSYPVVSKKLNNLLHRTYKKYWIGNSLTPWVKLLGCVRWDSDEDKKAVYKMSKYNQMSECAAMCSGSAFFMLQINSCYCLNEEEERVVTYVPYIQCDEPCPGQPREKCGGSNVFTFYEYYHGEVAKGSEMYNCVCRKEGFYNKQSYNKQCHCDDDIGFTCKMTNGSEITFNADIPRRKKSNSLYKAINFCAKFPGGLGMSPLPKYPEPYYGEEYWTTITRAVDWNYDSVAQRRPDFSSVSTLDRRGLYIETFKNASEKHGFICQHDFVSCGQEVEADDGNITSPDYPQKYEYNEVCKWQITVNDSKIIQLVITDMDIEQSQNCIYDYLSVIENATVSERLCGRHREKYMFTMDNSVTLVFRTDDTKTGTGFSLMWSAVDRHVLTETTTSSGGTFDKSSEEKALSGGVVVGITVAAAVLIVLLVAFLACVYYRKTHPARTVPNVEETSTAHNIVYAISSFNTGSSFNDDDIGAYLNVSQTRRNLKAEASYANDPNKVKENSGNIYLTINQGNNIEAGSKANLLLDSDSGASDTLDSRTTRVKQKAQSKEVSESGIDEAADAEESYVDMIDTANIDDIGKDCIKVESSKKITGLGQESSVAYTDVVFERPPNPSEMKEEDGYLNAGLTSDARMPHYEDIENTPHYAQVDKTGAHVKTENDASTVYLEL